VVKVKIRGGTVDHGDPPLCETCRYATVARGRTLREEVVFCSQMPFTDRRVKFAVTSCSDYSDSRRPSLYQMEEMAWVLRSDPTRKKIGFVKADELDEDERHARYE
jgi:hypothetical protein